MMQPFKKESGAVTTATSGAHNPILSPHLRSGLIRAYAIRNLNELSKGIKTNINKSTDASIKAFIEDSLYSHRFAGMTKSISERIKDYILRAIMHQYDKARVVNYIQKIAPGTGGYQAQNIFRTEVHALKNKTREWAYGQLDPEDQMKYKWIGPSDTRTTDICKIIQKKTEQGVSIAELKRIIADTVEMAKRLGKLPQDYDAREYTPHFQCRHTFIRSY